MLSACVFDLLLLGIELDTMMLRCVPEGDGREDCYERPVFGQSGRFAENAIPFAASVCKAI